MAVIHKVVSRCYVTGRAVLVLTSQLDSKVHIMNDVLFDKDPGAAIHVNAIGRFIVAVCRIAARCDAVNQIAADYSVASLVNNRVGRRALETNDVDSDVVVVVDNIVSNAKVRDVPVHYQRLARTGFEMMHLIAVNNQFTDRSLGVGTVNGNAKPVAASSRSITPVKSLLNMMRSEEHTSELQSRQYLVCRLLLEKKTKTQSAGIDAIPVSMQRPVVAQHFPIYPHQNDHQHAGQIPERRLLIIAQLR